MENNFKEEVSIKKLLDARKIFEKFRSNLEGEQNQAGAIQSFEFCYELAWKSIKKILLKAGTPNLVSPRDAFRAAATKGWIDNPELWFEFIQIRNIASHTYDNELVDEVIEVFPKFSKALDDLIEKLLEIENVVS